MWPDPWALCTYQYYAPLPTPLPDYVGEKVGHLTYFDTKTRPIRGEFDCSPYACAAIKSTDSQIPQFLSGEKGGI